jgi:hypothetical protein
VKPELAAQLWPDLVRRPRDERLGETGFEPAALREALATSRKLLKAKTTKFFSHEGEIVSQADVEDNDARLRAADQIYKLAGVYAPSEQAGRSHGAQVIVMLPDLRALYIGADGKVSITPANAALPSPMAESETVIDDAELA